MLLCLPDMEQLSPFQHEAVPVGAFCETIEKSAGPIPIHERIQRLAALAGKVQKPGTDGSSRIFHIMASR